MRQLKLFLLGAVLIVSPVAAPSTPTSGKYCPPLIFRDRVVGVGYQAVVRVQPGCMKPAMVRKENALTGSIIGAPNTVLVGEVVRVWVFTHRLRYTLDGVTWRRAVIR